MHAYILLTSLTVATVVTSYVIHELQQPKHGDMQWSIKPSEPDSITPTGTPDTDLRAYVLDGNKYVGESCYRITNEYEMTLSFDEVPTNGRMVFPDDYVGLKWSCRFRIVNETEQPFPPQNHATSHPNLLFADNKSIADGGCNDDGMDPWIAIDNTDKSRPLRVFDLVSVRHQPLYGLRVPVIVAFKQTYITGAPHRNGTRYYSHVYQSTLSYPYQIDLGFEYLTKVEFMVIPSGHHQDPARHPFFLDDIKLRFKDLMPVSGCRQGRPPYLSSEL